MARINTKTKLISFIRSQLGEPIINVEVTDPQIGEIIDSTVQRFSEYAYGTLESSVIIQLNGIGEYNLPDTITNIIKLSQGSSSNLTNFAANFGAGYVPDLWSQQFFSGSLTGDVIPGIIAISTTKAVLDKFFGDDIVYNFNPHRKVLNLLQNYVGGAILHYQYEYIAKDGEGETDLIYNHEWVKDYTIAKTKFLWGTITGKYSQTLVGGAQINYSDMKQEAEQEIEKLNESLLSKFSDPCPIAVG